MDLNDTPELFASEPVPKRKARTRRAPVVKSEPEPLPEIEVPATLGDLRAAGERFIREKPLVAVALAVGAGYLIGRLRR